MPLGPYYFNQVAGPVGIGVNESVLLSLNAYAKNNMVNTYCVANEFISAEIGRLLRLPIPPAGIMARTTPQTQERWFATLNFNGRAGNLPPVPPRQTVARFPELSTGLLIFDILIANSDRHMGNLSVDLAGGRMDIFDHSHALFGYMPGQGEARLDSIQGRLGISRGPVTQGNRHCLLDALQSDQHFDEWIERVEKIPDYFIHGVCEDAIDLGITTLEAVRAIQFLTERRDGMRELLRVHQAAFTGIRQWRLFA